VKNVIVKCFKHRFVQTNRCIKYFFICFILLSIIGCTASKKQASVSNESDGDVIISIPYKIEGKTTWSWQIFKPSIPNDVPDDIYSRLWDINSKTIKAGKFDFNLYNDNKASLITYNESAMSDNFTFDGIFTNYADYFLFLLEHDSVLLELYNRGVITANTSPYHKWIEYHTEKNRYIIDPTWCDWDYVGVPTGMYANNVEFAEACINSFNKEKLIEAKSKEWFFRNITTVTKEYDRRVHGLYGESILRKP
jgi:hypothetical protein